MDDSQPGCSSQYYKQRWKQEIPDIDNDNFMEEFINLFPKYHEDIKLEYCSKVKRKNCLHTKWAPIICTKCNYQTKVSSIFLKHILDCIFTDQERFYYEKFQLVTKEVNEVLNERLEDQSTRSYAYKTFGNTRHFRVYMRMNSILTPYIMTGILIYVGDISKNKVRNAIEAVFDCNQKETKCMFTMEKLNLKSIDKKSGRHRRRVKKPEKPPSESFELNVSDVLLTEKKPKGIKMRLKLNPVVTGKREFIIVNSGQEEESEVKESDDDYDSDDDSDEEEEVIKEKYEKSREFKNLESVFTSQFLAPRRSWRMKKTDKTSDDETSSDESNAARRFLLPRANQKNIKGNEKEVEEEKKDETVKDRPMMNGKHTTKKRSSGKRNNGDTNNSEIQNNEVIKKPRRPSEVQRLESNLTSVMVVPMHETRTETPRKESTSNESILNEESEQTTSDKLISPSEKRRLQSVFNSKFLEPLSAKRTHSNKISELLNDIQGRKRKLSEKTVEETGLKPKRAK